MGTRGQGSPGNGGVGLRPGQVVAGRYRIQRLLGKGAMGEVYRADDLALGRHVALKFPTGDGSVAGYGHRLAAEVAVAQRVSHPNVCRVHELGRYGKRVFLSMQLIEGETLRTILGRSVGTLTADEKLRIAHDLCAALSAIHAQGVLFRDLKPGNVMVDSDGRALVTDFGLATCGVVTDPGSGTFDYMAPEQLASRESGKWGEPSVQSDLYGLGLILYEVFVGRPAFSARSRKEIVASKLEGPPEFPADDLTDARAREVIVRCIAPAPDDRPASADKVAASLPERPARGSASEPAWTAPPETLLISPRWVARRWSGHAVLAAVLVALLGVVALAPMSQATRPAEIGNPPQALKVRAREVLSAAGLGGEAGAELSGYTYDLRQLEHIARSESSPDRWTDAATAPVPPVVFWYRRNPQRQLALGTGESFLRYDDPPLTVPGMVGVQLDPRGRLLRLEAVPPRVTGSETSASPPDWGPMFEAAGLDPERFRPVPPSWAPPAFADHRYAWEGPGEEGDGGAVRVEAASLGSLPVSFRRLEPWTLAPEPRPMPLAEVGMQVAASRIGRILAGLWFVGVLAGAVLLARRNLFRRVADRRTAFRLALVVLVARTLAWLLGAHQVPELTELLTLTPHLGEALLAAAQVWVIYVALEPSVRRFWPELSASGVRLVYGRLADPLVGRHLLVGTLFGTGAVLWSRLYAAFAGELGLPAPRPDALGTLVWMVQLRGLDLQCEALRGLRQALAMETLAVVHGVLVSLFAVVGVVLLRLAFKRAWLSHATALAAFVVLLFPRAGDPLADLVMAVGVSVLWLVALLGFGFLTAATATATAWLLSSHPLTPDLSAWYAPGSTVALLAVLAVALWGFKTSLAGRPLLPPEWLRLDVPRASGKS